MTENNIRFEVNHNGEVVKHDSEFCNNINSMIVNLFSQYGWHCEIIETKGSFLKLSIKNPQEDEKTLNVFKGTIRDESRSPYEKKTQLGNNANPLGYDKHNTIILGVYVYETNDELKDAIFVSFPINDAINYSKNPSLRGVQTNKIIQDAKTKGFVHYKESNNIGFRPEFVYYYLDNFYNIHYQSQTAGENTNAAGKTIEDEFKFESDYPWNRILFGAPGTGKSYKLNKDKENLLEQEGYYERVTFHPDYSYANFVGTYKPVPSNDANDNECITYKYVPGPFMRTLAKALKNHENGILKPHLLVIEEINRANMAAVFGDIFQLLDRNENGYSEYPIQASEDIKKYLASELGGEPSNYNKLQIPSNMFIWATMNSADQGIYPMDTAFKRRWDFEYISIDNKEEEIEFKNVKLGKENYQKEINWNNLRKAINNYLSVLKINEDKLIGPYFISRNVLLSDNNDKFISAFKNKVLMYLFEDAAKQKRASVFSINTTKYSSICEEFDEKGINVFCNEITSNVTPIEA